LFCDAEFFESFEDDIGSLFAKTNSSLFEPFGLFHEICQISTWTSFLWLLFCACIGFIKQAFQFLCVLSKLIYFFLPEAFLSQNIVFDILGVILKKLISFGIIIDNHLLKHLDQMVVNVGVSIFYGLKLSLHLIL